MITAQNIRLHELIGLRVKVAQSLCMPYEGMAGRVADETKNTLVLCLKDGSERRIPKKGCVFDFTLPDGSRAALEGDKIACRAYDRPKKLK